MQNLTQNKIVSITPPAAIVDNAAFTTATVDTKGFDEALFVISFGAMDIAATVLKVQESDDSGMSGAADISGADFSVSPATLPVATSDNTFFGVHVKLGGSRKRYMDILLTGGDGTTGTYATGFVLLSKAETSPATATDRGFAQLLSV